MLPNISNKLNSNTFGSLKNGRNFSAGSGYRFGFNGHEKDGEINDNGNYLSFGNYGFYPQIGVRWNIDPNTAKFPFVSPYIFALNNPILCIDPDGKEVKGFLMNENGEVVITKKASKDAVAIYNAIAKTEMGLNGFKEFITSETKVKLRLTKRPLLGHAKTKTHGVAKNNEGLYRKVTIVVSTAKRGDRFDDATKDELINVVTLHEKVHALDKEQIKIDRSSNYTWSWKDESIPINTEYSAWKEWKSKSGQDITKIKNFYESPDSGKLDPTGKPKPAQFGVDKKGKVLNKPAE